MSLIAVNWNPGAQQLRTFGITGAVAALVLGSVIPWRQAVFGIALAPEPATLLGWAFGLAALLLAIVSSAAPTLLRPLYVGLTAVSLPIGFVVSYLMLLLLFFGVLLPFGIAFRLGGRDALTRRFERSRSSYWTRRDAVTDPGRYYHQY